MCNGSTIPTYWISECPYLIVDLHLQTILGATDAHSARTKSHKQVMHRCIAPGRSCIGLNSWGLASVTFGMKFGVHPRFRTYVVL